MKRFGWVLTSALVIGACAGSEAATDRDPAVRAAQRLEVVRGDFTSRMLLTGELVAEDAEQLVTPNANIWPVQIRWLAEDGIEVREGDKLVEFDNSQLTANLEEMRAQATEAANRLASLEAQAASEEAQTAFELAQRRATVEKARIEASVPEGVLSALKWEQRQLEFEKAELSMAEAESKLESTRRAKRAEVEMQRISLAKTQADVARSEARIDILTLTASRDGILILENNRREGRPIQEGDGIFPGTVVGRLPDLSTLMVQARLFDVDDGRVEPGMSVVATLDAFPELEFTGRVREVDQIADQPSSRSLRRFFRTKIDLDRADPERMRPGMSVKLVIEERHEDALLVPRGCLDWSEDGPRARRADGDWAPVKLGPCDHAVCVLESGLEESAALGRVVEVSI
ncbi:MAG: HlyD family efflux transporter periplasmic adaptor subunit [bacterium]|nr:HlyD family efflux transporter periplasmic adaptor subunit [bacterium]